MVNTSIDSCELVDDEKVAVSVGTTMNKVYERSSFSAAAGTPVRELNRLNMLRRLDIHSQVKWPTFDPQNVRPGIVHLGCGAFHRAHQNVFTQEAIEAAGRGNREWGVVGVSFRTSEVQRLLAPQDHLYTVLEHGQDEVHAQVVGILRGVLFAREQQQRVIAAIRNPKTKIVTLTVTASGYQPCPSGPSGSEPVGRGEGPPDAIGLLVCALAAIRAKGGRPPVLMSCDNMPRNGLQLRDALVQRASLSSESLAKWIASNVQFPCSVVDRIVPVPTAADSTEASGLLGLRDRATVSTEPFRQWVIEEFEGPRPSWELAGAKFVNDASAWECSKLNLLNGTHMAIAYLGMLAGLDTVASFVCDPLFGSYTSRLMHDEQIPTIPKSDHDLRSYSRQLLERWRNVSVVHRLQRIGRNGSEKLKARLLGSLASNIAAGRPAPCTVLAVAAWICCAARLVPGSSAVEDPAGERLQQLALHAAGDTGRFVQLLAGLPEIFGEELPQLAVFQDDLGRAVEALRVRGARAAIASVMSGSRELVASL